MRTFGILKHYRKHSPDKLT